MGRAAQLGTGFKAGIGERGLHGSLGLPLISVSAATWMFIYILLLLAGAIRYGSTEQYCNMESFNASCPHNQVILIKTAKYGRMEIGRCVKRNLGYLGCSVDVLVYMDRECSGQKRCEVNIPNPTLYASQPCPEDTTPYLDVTYECIPVATGSKAVCHTKKELVLTQSTGYVASTVTKDDGLGSVMCPWLIRAQPGQRISLSLLNLYRSADSFQLMPGFGEQLGRPEVCYEFALLRDGSHTKSLTSCGGETRRRNVYLSRTNEVRVQFVNPNVLQTLGTYLLEYKAVGCPRLKVPKDGWAQVDGETAVIKCNFTDETWYLTCKGTAWLGQTGNCTRDDPAWHLGDIIGSGASFPYGILIVVAIGVALGVFFGGILLTVVVVYMRRRHRHPRGDVADGATSDDADERLRVSKYMEQGGGDRLQWTSDQHKYRPTILEEHCPQDGGGTLHDATSSFTTIDRNAGFTTTGSSVYKGGMGVADDPSGIYFEKEMSVRTAVATTGGLPKHIYESPQFSS